MRYNAPGMATARALTSPAKLRPLLEQHRLWLRKRLGQHFLCDANILDKIVKAAEIGPGDAVLEIGAGIGTLTLALAKATAKVVAVEIDDRLVPLLRENLAGLGNVEILHADILKIQPARVVSAHADCRAGLRRPAAFGAASPEAAHSRAQESPRPCGGGRRRARPTETPTHRWKVVANLPYSITGPVIVHLLHQRPRPELMVLMVQKEVADRLLSAPGSKEYGSLSVLAQATMEIERVATVSRNCFFPVPNVDSAIIGLRPRKKVAVPTRLSATFERVLRASFGQRRKTLLNALSGSALGLSRAAAAEALAAAGIPPQARAESLDAAQFGSLTRAVHSVLSEADQK